MTADKQPLLAEIDDAHERLGELERDLRDVDGLLASFAVQNEQYRLLEGVCAMLDSIEQLGAADVFWGKKLDAAGRAQHLRDVRQRVAEFVAEVRAAEDKRLSILGRIAEGGEVLSILEGDLRDIEDEEIERSLEWVVEREIGPVTDGPNLPWVRGGEEDLRLRKSLGSSLLAASLVASILLLVHLPPPEVMPVEKVPERIVKFIELDQHKPAPLPPPPMEQPKPKEQEPLVAEQRKADVPKPAPTPAEEPKPVEPPRQRAEKAGILAFRESFAQIAERRPSAKLGAQASVSNTGERNTGPTERSLITSLAASGSGGINVASLSRAVGGDGGGGGALDGVDVGRVADSIGGAPGDRGGPNGSRSGTGALAGRTDEEIQIVFDRYKAALYRLYNRELRNDPTLRGQMVLRLTIEPDGSVSMCKLQASDMNAPALSEQVVERVKTFAFGAKDVPAVTIVYPIDFLPAA